MAETTAQTNNRSVTFRGEKEREMPSVSQAQSRFMHAAAEGEIESVSPEVGKEFVKADEGRSIKKLPKRAGKLHKRGLISDKAMKKIRERA